MRDPIDLSDPLGSLWLPSDPATVPIWRPGDPPWPELCCEYCAQRSIASKVRVAELAERQEGRVATDQLAAMGISTDRTFRWTEQRFLIPELPRVYAVGHAARSVDAELVAALLYAGPGAMMDSLVAGWWVGAVRDRPARISISTPRQCRAIETPGGRAFAGIDLHGRRTLERIWLPHNPEPWRRQPRGGLYLPVTPIRQLMRDLAVVLDGQHLRWALANVEYRRLMDLSELADVCGRGRPGSAALGEALRGHLPLLARTKSRGERRLLFVLEDHDVRLPDDVNVKIAGIESDAVWRREKLIVEIDGEGNHGTPGQALRDARNDAALRALGWKILRYDEDRLRSDPAGVAAEIAAHLAARSPRG